MTTESNVKGQSVERRGVLVWLIRGFLSLWAMVAAVVVGLFVKAPRHDERGGRGLVRCGTLSTLPVGEARFVQHGASPIFVVRAAENEVLAVSAVCTHVRCILKWNRAGRSFVCPCHAGAFDQQGNVLSGPPPRPLPQYRVEVRSDEIVVHV